MCFRVFYKKKFQTFLLLFFLVSFVFRPPDDQTRDNELTEDEPPNEPDLHAENKRLLAENKKLISKLNGEKAMLHAKNSSLKAEKKQNRELKRQILTKEKKQHYQRKTILGLRKNIIGFKKKIQRVKIRLQESRNSCLDSSGLVVRRYDFFINIFKRF